MASKRVKQLAQEYPDAFESIATAYDDELGDAMLEILSETKHREPVTADD